MPPWAALSVASSLRKKSQFSSSFRNITKTPCIPFASLRGFPLCICSRREDGVLGSKTKRPPLASDDDRHLAEGAAVILFAVRAMRAGRYPTIPAAWRPAIEAEDKRLELAVIDAVARVAYDKMYPPGATNGGGRPSREEEIRTAFDEMPQPRRLELLKTSKKSLYAELRTIITKKTGSPTSLGDHAMYEALKGKLNFFTPETSKT
jgi:hypothetical protein